jgi:hypothetical protein
MLRKFVLLFLVFFFCGNIFTQTNNSEKKPTKERFVSFTAQKDQKFGSDAYGIGKPINYYDVITLSKGTKYRVANKSVGYNLSEPVNAVLSNFKQSDLSLLQFLVNDSSEVIPFYSVNDTLLTLLLPQKRKDYFVSVRYKGKITGKLNVKVFRPITEKIAIVSLIDKELDEEYLEEFLNEIYKQANIKLDIISKTTYSDTLFNKEFIFDNPSSANDRYTRQMRDLRDRYFEKNPKATKNAYYLFIVPGFVDEELKGYMARNHAIGFIKYNNEPDMFHSIARELGHGIGMLDHFWNDTKIEQGSTLNLMDRNGGSELMRYQWLDLRHSSNSYSFYDGDEDIKTNNGMVAYYFWEENKDGFIDLKNEHPLSKIVRPFKKNYLSYHLNINDRLFEVIFEWNNYFLCLWHLIIWGILIIGWMIWRIILFRKRRKPDQKPGFLKRKLSNWMINGLFLSLMILSFFLINSFLKNFEVESGLIADFNKLKIESAMDNILYNKNLKYNIEDEPKSEILIKRGDDWYMKRKKKVLYFDVFKNKENEFSKCKFASESDSLLLSSLDFRDKAESHYCVFSFRGPNDSLEYQRVFNHLGIDITDKLELNDAAKRILVFVNGYRPTSVGHSFEDNFKDIKSKGLEFPNSINLIYDFDRFDYWSPWNNIDYRFQKRINPSDTYYADGHFSVTTSNHESLLNFTHLITIYPKRCKDPKKHVCWKTTKNSTGIFGDKTVDTYDLLPVNSNKKGFKERYRNGKIAAKNLLLMFNEIPNKSKNDTIYLVAHSMGYAYSLGMVEELRGNINFGGFYILAPENASQGKVYLNEWQEVWQYGSKLNRKEKEPPCLQDGVAPQRCAGGLSEANRAYIPNRFYNRKGFFDSHFVGSYTWIFDIEQGKKGAIKQR